MTGRKEEGTERTEASAARLCAAVQFYAAASAGGNDLFIIRGSNSHSHNKPLSVFGHV